MMRDLLHRLDQVPGQRILLINCLLAGLVFVAHGGFVLFFTAWGDLPPEVAVSVRKFRIVAAFSLPLSVAILLSALASRRNTARQGPVLAAHSIVLALGAATLLGWSISLLMGEVPAIGLSWTPGLLTLIVGYSAYLLRRFVLLRVRDRSPVANYLHVIAALFALVVDLSVTTFVVGASP